MSGVATPDIHIHTVSSRDVKDGGQILAHVGDTILPARTPSCSGRTRTGSGAPW